VNDYLHPEWQEVFRHQGLIDFETIWDLDIPLLDRPNTSRGGISSVARLPLQSPGNLQRTVIVKRQQNHKSRTWRHPLRGLPTTHREFINIRRFERFRPRNGHSGLFCLPSQATKSAGYSDY
jgi:hypothetical protein